MKKFNLFIIVLAVFFTACNSSHSTSTQTLKSEIKICPKCNMELAKSNIYSASLMKNGTKYYFDDIGCLVLWSSENDVSTDKVQVFSNDTHKYIDAHSAYFLIGEETPMSYGFSAYEQKQENQINFDEVKIKILRGEHMANPKIRKQILGY